MMNMSSTSGIFMASAILFLLASLPHAAAKGGGRSGNGGGSSVRIGILYIPMIYVVVASIFVFIVILTMIYVCCLKSSERFQRWKGGMKARIQNRRDAQTTKAHEMREGALDGTGIKNPVLAPAGYQTVHAFDQPYQPPHGYPVHHPYTYNHNGESSQSTFVIPAGHHGKSGSGQWTAQDGMHKPSTPVPYAQGGMGYTTDVGYAHSAHPPPATTFTQGHGPHSGPNAV